MKKLKIKKIYLIGIIMVAALPLMLFLVNSQEQVTQHAAGGNITIEYSQPIRTLDPLAVGAIDESAYGGPNVLVNDKLEQQKIKTLGPKYMRINLRYSVSGDPTSKIVCGAQGCDGRWSGDEWVNSIKAVGAEPVVEDPVNPRDLPLLVKHFNKDTHNRVNRWLGGINEPNIHGQDAITYSNNFNANYDAMKTVDPTIKIGGPTTAWYSLSFIQPFLTISGSRVDFIDFHGYGQGAVSQRTYDQLFAKAVQYEADITDLTNRIKTTIPSRASQIGIEVGEYDLDYAGHLLEYTQFDNAWGASALGHIIRAGGIDMLYADKGNLLLERGVEIPGGQLDETTPMYHALGMYTGEGLFPHFGTTMIQATTTLPNIEIYASDNPKNLVVINKDPAQIQNGMFQLNGISTGTVHIWRKDQTIPVTNPPQQVGVVALTNGSFSSALPPFSVTTFVVSTATNPNPTYYCIVGVNNNCVPTMQQTVSETPSTAPNDNTNTPSEMPTLSPVLSSTPSQNPCNASVTVAKTKKEKSHHHQNGNVSNLMNLLIQFLEAVLKLLEQLVGGNKNPGTSTTPCSH